MVLARNLSRFLITTAILRVVLTSEGFHVSNGHSEYRELVRLPREGAAGGHHVRQLRDVGRHLVPPPALNFAMILPTVSCKKSHRSLHFFSQVNHHLELFLLDVTKRKRWIFQDSSHVLHFIGPKSGDASVRQVRLPVFPLNVLRLCRRVNYPDTIKLTCRNRYHWCDAANGPSQQLILQK